VKPVVTELVPGAGEPGAAASAGAAPGAGRTATIAVVGLGYVGLPTALALRAGGRPVLGIDVSGRRLAQVRERRCDLTPADHERLAEALGDPAGFTLTDSPERLGEAEAVVICVPTPIDAHHVPEIGALRAACATVCEEARRGQTIILTSTTHVGATRELLIEPLGRRGLRVGREVCVAFSPERIDPANTAFPQELVPRVLGADSERCAQRARAVVAAVAPSVHLVSSPEAAEMTKLYENSFRAVNITLANEMAEAARSLGLSATEIVDAAATKPYGFMPFRPGPGVGGHCIPCDPHYLLWQLRAARHSMPMLERAMAGIAERPRQVADRAGEVLSRQCARGVAGARILIAGVAYKPGVADVRESPALELIELLERRGAEVAYCDPLVPLIERPQGTLISVGDPDLADYDLLIAHTVHPGQDLGLLEAAPALLDCTYRVDSETKVDL